MSNLNCLKEYAEKNYEKNRESFSELKKITGDKKLNIFSFGCGLGLDYVGAKEIFGNKKWWSGSLKKNKEKAQKKKKKGFLKNKAGF